jgi:hypothetical protein
LTTRKANIGLIGFILCLLCLDFGYGIAQGHADTLFHPIYRMRQTIAVALSRMREPPLHNYLAYQSVIDSLNESGFAIFRGEKGPPFDVKRTNELLIDGALIDAAFAKALTYPIDESLPPDIIRGNERGYADFVYLSFSLFGTNAISLYYFYYLLLAISVVVFIFEFKDRPGALFLLSAYLSSLPFMMEYATAAGVQVQALQNSRTFGVFTLLPMLHLLLATIYGRGINRDRIIRVAIQAMLMGFMLMSRLAVFWQFLVIFSVAGAYAALILFRHKTRADIFGFMRIKLMPAGVLIIATLLNIGWIVANEDQMYQQDSAGHLFWHNVLAGALVSSPVLQENYVVESQRNGYGDRLAYEAVMADLTRRDDASPSIASRYNGTIVIRPDRAWGEYEALARSLVLRMALSHPFEISKGFTYKLKRQYNSFFVAKLPWSDTYLSIALFLAGGILAVASGSLRTLNGIRRKGGLAAFLIAGLALVPVLIFPSKANIDVLLAYFLVGFVILFVVAADLTFRLAQLLRHRYPNELLVATADAPDDAV